MGSSATATLPTGFKIGTDWSTGTSRNYPVAYGTTGTGSSCHRFILLAAAVNWAKWQLQASSSDQGCLVFLTTNGSFTSPRSISI
jgi:hypothetical protein